MRTMSALRTECRKFAPNIFNKTKCSNCFKQREEHSAEALECNRASRKVSKCGYLFVAPGWDFSDPINRTKRWQRRWFVLYDDGEFTYSVDEHPETVPQCIIDMNSVLEVTPAEDITGHAHSIALTAPDGVHFVKGTSLEESRWWCEVLSVFIRTKGRHKRNATFPGGKSTTMLQPSRVSVPAEKSLMSTRPRFNSCHTEPVCRVPSVSSSSPLSDVFTPQPSLLSPSQGYEDQPASSDSPPTRDKLQSECKTRYRRALAREKRAWRNELGSSAMIETDSPAAHTARHLLLDDETRRGEKLKDIADCITRPRRPTSLVLPPRSMLEPTRDTGPPAEHDKAATPADKPVRGDPDGCGLDSVSTHCFAASGSGTTTAELRVDLPAEDLLHLKKGWLMKQVLEKQDWVKHWFVLRGSALMYYRDPSAEDNGILDGVIDLGMVQRVSELQVARNYGFEIVPWDEKKVVVSAVTAGIRANWVQALRRAAGLPATEIRSPSAPSIMGSELRGSSTAEPQAPPSSQRASLGARLERQLESASLHRPVSRLRPQELGGMSSDDEYRTASSETSAGAHSEWGDAEEACVAAPLPSSSPPLNRTPISRVKERARSRVARRSRTSPPPLGSRSLISQRRRTLPNDTTDMPERLSTLFSPPHSSSPASETSTLLSPTPISPSSSPAAVTPTPVEAQTEARLKALECQLADALSLIEVRDKEMQTKTRELAELQQISQRYSSLRQEHQVLSQQWRERLASEEQWRHSYQQSQASLESEREESQKKLTSLRHENEERVQQLSSQVAALQDELEKVKDRLQRGIEENEILCARLREVKASPASTPSMHRRLSRRSLSRVDSLSDLASCTSLEEAELTTWDRDRLEEEYMETVRKLRVALSEIHATRKELRMCQAECDQLEIQTVAARQAGQQQMTEHQAREAMLARRVDDLTLKLSAAERQLRQLPPALGSPQLQKFSRGSEKRRSLSLRGRESMQQVSREMEEKLTELESKLATLQRKSASTEQLPTKKILDSPRSAKKLDALCLENKGSPRLQRKSSRRKSDLGPLLLSSTSPHSQSPPPQRATRALRRKSLDSSPSLELLLRLRLVETKLTQLAGNTGVVVNEPELIRSSTSTPTGDRSVNDETTSPKDLLVMVPECFGDEEGSQNLTSSSTSVSQSTEDIARQEPCAALVPTAQKLVAQLWEAMGVSRQSSATDTSVECKEVLEASDAFMTEHRLRLSSQPAVLMQMATVSAFASLLRRCIITREAAACEEITALVNNISGELQALPSKPVPCQHCEELDQSMDRLRTEHQAELRATCERLTKEREQHSEKESKEWQALVAQHEEQVHQLRENVHRLEARLGALDSEYSQQVAGLRASYQLSLEQAARGVEGAGVGLDEGVRQRYKTEIQQLRALCEKGLVAMENSHRRIVAELREEHEQQLEQLRQEKEEALAEETQATLAALDAMRKAHEVEVQREIEKFKSQFLDKLKASPDVRQLHREHEQEMSGIRREILSLSEKYSLKCMEAAQLEDQLAGSARQLQQSQQLISELETRNQQLRQHLISDTRSDVPDSPCSAVSDSFLLQSSARSVRGKGPGVELRTRLASTPRPLSHQPSLSFALGPNGTVRGTSLQGMVAQRKKLFEH